MNNILHSPPHSFIRGKRTTRSLTWTPCPHLAASSRPMFGPFLFLLPPLPPSSTDLDGRRNRQRGYKCPPCRALPSAGQWPLLANLALTSSSAFFGGGGLWTAAFHPSFLALLVLAVELGGLGRQLLGFSNIGRLRCEFPPLSTIAHLIEAPCRESLSANDIPLPFPLFLTWREGGRRRRLVALSYVLVVAVKSQAASRPR